MTHYLDQRLAIRLRIAGWEARATRTGFARPGVGSNESDYQVVGYLDELIY